MEWWGVEPAVDAVVSRDWTEFEAFELDDEIVVGEDWNQTKPHEIWNAQNPNSREEISSRICSLIILLILEELKFNL